jgi:hypothetical protein
MTPKRILEYIEKIGLYLLIIGIVRKTFYWNM